MAASISKSPTEQIQTPKRRRFGQLEALRGFAALYVVAHHVWVELSPNLETSPLRFLLKHGMLAVMVFFVLSGFVIEYSTAKGSINDFKLYFRKRFARIYPLFLIALLVSYLINCVLAGRFIGLDGRNLLGNLLMLQGSPGKAGDWFEPYGGNGPLWSLSYEWWFYMMYFPIRNRIPEAYQAPLVAGLSVAGLITNYFIQPNQISTILTLFVVWWLGVEIARGRLRDGITSLHHVRTPLTGMLTITILLVLLPAYSVQGALFSDLAHYQLTSFVYALVIVPVGFAWQRIQFAGFDWVFGPFYRFGQVSYSIYIFHGPIVLTGARLFPAEPPLLVYGCLMVALGVFCYAMEVGLQPRIAHGLVPRLAADRIQRERTNAETARAQAAGSGK